MRDEKDQALSQYENERKQKNIHLDEYNSLLQKNFEMGSKVKELNGMQTQT